MKFPVALVLVAALGLAGCSSWLGESESDKPRLPGKRISILSGEKTLEAEVKGAEAAIKLPPPDPNDDWPQAGGYSNHAMHHMEVGDSLKRVWRTSIGSGSGKRIRLLAQPIVAEGRVFTMDTDTEIRAIDAKTGSEIWRSEITPDDEDNSLSGGGLAYEDGVVFASTGFAQVVALDARNGKVIWRQTLSGPMRGSPTVRGGRVFVVTVDNQTHCLAAEDGSVQWTHQGISESAALLAGTSPAVDGNVVVVPYSSGELFALRVDNGSMLWQEQLSTVRRTDNVATLADIRGRPVIDRGRVYAIGHADMLVAIDLRTGRRIWDREIGGVQTPWVAGDYLYVVSNNNEAMAMEARTGRILWVTQLPEWKDEKAHENRITWAGPVLASDRLIFGGSNEELLTLSPYTGEIIGKMDMPDGMTISPTVALKTIFFLTEDAELVAYR